ncbi:Type 1 glutamine amidotransferase-like domain-containing protein [Bacteriovoracaceae bacterium]|nr:Type 1 glutamine amidotransferase-like domain-containing protein [Bacteriovoracaceae bacterium]
MQTEGVTDSIPGQLSALECLGLLSGSNCPHYDGEADRRDSYHRLQKNGMKPGIACDDGVAAYFINGKLKSFVSSRKDAKAYKVGMTDSKIIEEPVQPNYLADGE